MPPDSTVTPSSYAHGVTEDGPGDELDLIYQWYVDRYMNRLAKRKTRLRCVGRVYNLQCEEDAVLGRSEVPLCKRHFGLLLQDLRWAFSLEQTAKLSLQRKRADRRSEAERSVYYMERWDGMVKIGFSGNVEARKATLEEEFGPLDLLATEVGGRIKERQRHEEFAHLRQGRSEWFAVDDDLRAHIDRCSRAHAERT